MMKNFFGATITTMGFVAVIGAVFALLKSQTPVYQWVGAALLPFGGLVALSGGLLTTNWGLSQDPAPPAPATRPRWTMSQGLFGLCFVASVLVGIMGAGFLFQRLEPGMGWVVRCGYVLLLGFVGAFISALAALTQD